MKHRYFLTGASGFVGSNIVRVLVSRGEEVHVLLRNGIPWRLTDLQKKITVHEGDILSSALPRILADASPTVIFHLASFGAMPQEKDVDRIFDVNVGGITNLLSHLPKSVELFVNTGSSSEYGIKDMPMDEDMTPEPVNDYGVAKASATLYALKVAATSAFPIVTLRLFSPFGPYEQKTRFIPHVISSMLHNEQLELSSPSFVRDFVYIDDVVAAYLSCVTQENTVAGHIINIGSGKQHSLGDVVDAVSGLLGELPRVSWDENRKQGRQVEPKIWQADITKAKKLLDWKPAHTLKLGLKKTIDWMKEHTELYEN